MNLDELYGFLEMNFGGSGLQGWFEISHLDFTVVPVQTTNEQYFWKGEEKINEGNLDVVTCCPRLVGSLCKCSSTDEQHMEKVFTLSNSTGFSSFEIAREIFEVVKLLLVMSAIMALLQLVNYDFLHSL